MEASIAVQGDASLAAQLRIERVPLGSDRQSSQLVLEEVSDSRILSGYELPQRPAGRPPIHVAESGNAR